jgi:hypothetical protein
MKKLLVGLIVLVALLSVPMTVSADTKTMDVGATVVAAVNITYAANESAAAWELNYDSPETWYYGPDDGTTYNYDYGTLDVDVTTGSAWSITAAEAGGDGSMNNTANTIELALPLAFETRAAGINSGTYTRLSTAGTGVAMFTGTNDDATFDLNLFQEMADDDLEIPADTEVGIVVTFTATITA